MISGLILAAGSSSRLGRPKQLLELHGKPILQHVADAAHAAGLDEVVVVLGHAEAEVQARIAFPDGTRVVVNPVHEEGQSSSLRTGLDALDRGSEAAVILLGDQPRISPMAVRRVVDAFLETRPPIARASYDDGPGHPVLIAREVWDEIREVRGDVGARDLLTGDRVLEVRVAGPVPEDVDTQAQYERLLRSEGSGRSSPGD